MSIFAIGLSGLRAAQSGLFATSGNISNVGTPGYNRELVQLSENRAAGVLVNGVERQFNQFVATRLNAASGSLASFEAYHTQVKQIDNLLSDERAGLAPAMQEFFKAIGQVNSNPADPAARAGVMGTAGTLTAQFRSFDNYLNDIERNIGNEITYEVNSINSLNTQIASLNKEILLARSGGTEAPNSLLNQRDQLVHELSQKMDVRVYEQSSGSYSVSMSNGLPLVAGDKTYELEAQTDQADPTRLAIVYTNATGQPIQLRENVFSRGSLGGLLEFRSESLDTLRNQLGQMVAVFASAMNEQHQQGVDLNQDPGQAMFSMGSPLTYSHSANTGDATATTTITDATALLATDFAVQLGPDGYQVTRLDNGKTVPATFDAATNTLSFAGVEVSFAGGAVAEGDRFKVRPLVNQAKNFELELEDGSQFAAAQSNASGDNSNSLALQELQNQLLVEGKGTFNQAYGSMVSTLGNQINVVQANMAAQQGLTEQLYALQQSESGVNLDEEAANLIRYQQYYQANAKVIETGSTILDTILSLR
ncbi:MULTISPECIES: flagellar hook-associated protein FlgK [Idiomarina]|uniref:flagellar hook-associated protein FlgK n=1 Tax=Idiomarina TaxID=135575 RepID=UPI00129C3A06|nr:MULTISPECIES: flagellar hook-associated protein FlgK [Idiomarina]MRJ42092.1 flagellar hook-associated protein FlgK [Idiomarina sp. FeN1]NCU57017.1 flagellar hook-associated protein FlgK [Idiomarina sp. FenA--70]NCU59726.1 flagellar hook-associated protein FlgK [Idiomarina sp. FenBw--71]UUN13282.1 flagellar hook-associated protein FlgK [Idiomarina loihiensis]